MSTPVDWSQTHDLVHRVDRGPWFLTHTGKQFHPKDPRPSDICIEDIAHALSHICRYGGHCEKFYSVAQHSVHVAELLWDQTQDPTVTLQGLLHDATEAYCGDVVHPLKCCLGEPYARIEARVWTAVMEKFNLPATPEVTAKVKRADITLLLTEKRDLLAHGDKHNWPGFDDIGIEPLEERVVPMYPKASAFAFTNLFNELSALL